MATTNKNFKVKNGLVVEGSTATVNSFDVLTKNPTDQAFIASLAGAGAAITSASEPFEPLDGTIWVDINESINQFAGAEDLVNKILMGVI